MSSGQEDEVGLIFDVAGTTPPLELDAQVDTIRAVDWSPDGALVILAGTRGNVQAFDPETGEFVQSMDLKGDWVDSVSFSPDSSLLATGGHDSELRLFDPISGRQLGDSLTSHLGWVNRIVWSPDGARLATASTDLTVRIWNVSGVTGRLELDGHDDEVISLAWSPDSRRIVTASADATAIVWDATTGTELHVLAEHEDLVRATDWSPDGRRIVTGGDDGRVIVWDGDNGSLLMELGGERLGLRRGVGSRRQPHRHRVTRWDRADLGSGVDRSAGRAPFDELRRAGLHNGELGSR